MQAQINELRAEIEELKTQLLISNAAPTTEESAETIVANFGLYRVPQEVAYGTWMFKSSGPAKSYYITTYSAMNPVSDNMIDYISSENQGYFEIRENTKLVEFDGSYGTACVFTCIDD